MKLESEVQQEIQVQAMHFKCTLMRNNSGAFKDETGRLIRYGLGNISKQHNERIASSDLIGITKVLITQDMVGQTLGVFTAAECKKEEWNKNKKLDKRELAQQAFINWVKSQGGFAEFINSVDNLSDLFRK